MKAENMMEFTNLVGLLAQRGEVDIIPLVAVSCLLGGPFAVAIIYVVLHSIGSIVRSGLDANLKLKMLKLGYSAADIERVLQAGPNVESKAKSSKAPYSEIVLAQPIK
jgi:hypothetical protein